MYALRAWIMNFTSEASTKVLRFEILAFSSRKVVYYARRTNNNSSG